MYSGRHHQCMYVGVYYLTIKYKAIKTDYDLVSVCQPTNMLDDILHIVNKFNQ